MAEQIQNPSDKIQNQSDTSNFESFCFGIKHFNVVIPLSFEFCHLSLL